MPSQITFETKVLSEITGVTGGTLKRWIARRVIEPAVPPQARQAARWTVPVAFGIVAWKCMRDWQSCGAKEAEAALRFISRQTAFELEDLFGRGFPGLCIINGQVFGWLEDVPDEATQAEFQRRHMEYGRTHRKSTMSITWVGNEWEKLKRKVAALPARATEE